MIHASGARFLALVAGLSASLAGPAVSFAHGYAHSEATEHAAHHAPIANVATDHPTVGAHEHDADHGHPRVEPSAFPRLVKNLPAIHSERVTLALADVSFRDTRDAPEPNESPPDRPGVSPVHSRAPPTL